MIAGSVHLLLLFTLPPLLANILLHPKERSDTALPDLDFDLEDGLLESQPDDDTKKFLVDNLVPQSDLEVVEFDPGPFQLLPAKRKFHEMIAADLFFNLLTKFALYMILVSCSKIRLVISVWNLNFSGLSGDSDNYANHGAPRQPCRYNWHHPLVVAPHTLLGPNICH